MSGSSKLQVVDMLEALHKYLSAKDWESSEKVADAIKKRVEALDLWLSPDETLMVQCGIAGRDIREDDDNNDDDDEGNYLTPVG